MRNEKNIAIGAAVLAILFYLIGRKGRKTIRIKAPVNSDYIDPGFDPVSFAATVADAVHGLDFTSKKAKVFEQLIYLNDEEFKAVYNEYNRTHARNGNTMRNEILGEWFFGSGRKAIVERFNKLNLP